MKIIGIDPSLRNFGFAVAEIDIESMQYRITDLRLVTSEADKKAGKQVRKNSDDLCRARQLYEGMIEICQGAAFAIAEVPVGSQSARAMASYGMCVGVLAACPIPLIEVTPSEVKMAAIGSKFAAKEEMIEWAMMKHPAAPWLMRKVGGVPTPIASNEHLADACAAIEAGLKTQQMKQAISLLKAAKAA